MQKLKTDFKDDKIFTNQNKFKAALGDVKIEADDIAAKKIRRLLSIAMCEMQAYSRLKSELAGNPFIIANLAAEMSSVYMIGDNHVSKTVIECIAELLGYEPVIEVENEAEIAGVTRQAEPPVDDTQNDYKMGLAYYRGDAVEKNFITAQYLLFQAAIRGNVEAQFVLGELLIDETNENGNLLQAIDWFSKAAENGHATAQVRLGAAYYNGLGIETDKNKAKFWFAKSAEQGNSEGQYGLGMYYFDLSDYIQAEHWIRIAAESGHPEASATLMMVSLMLRR
jgi:hypothetical protein